MMSLVDWCTYLAARLTSQYYLAYVAPVRSESFRGISLPVGSVGKAIFRFKFLSTFPFILWALISIRNVIRNAVRAPCLRSILPMVMQWWPLQAASSGEQLLYISSGPLWYSPQAHRKLFTHQVRCYYIMAVSLAASFQASLIDALR